MRTSVRPPRLHYSACKLPLVTGLRPECEWPIAEAPAIQHARIKRGLYCHKGKLVLILKISNNIDTPGHVGWEEEEAIVTVQ